LKKKILLHICCAPDGTTAIERLEENFEVIGYFGNSNIQPEGEYLKRKDAVAKMAEYYGIEVIFGKYEPDRWQKEMQGLELLPEKGVRCRKCIFLNLRETAEMAERIDVTSFTTSLMTSPHKDVNWIEICGRAIEKKCPSSYYHEVFRKKDGFLNSVKKSAEIGLYRQNYCGCIYSIHD